MTIISLEEHVARAIWSEDEDEHDTCNRGNPDFTWEAWPQSGPEASRACVKSKDEYFSLARAAIAAVCEHEGKATRAKNAQVRESERAACEAIARGEKVDSDATNDECDEAYNMACDHIADAIAARKGKGEGK